jgi:hypothetical protein
MKMRGRRLPIGARGTASPNSYNNRFLSFYQSVERDFSHVYGVVMPQNRVDFPTELGGMERTVAIGWSRLWRGETELRVLSLIWTEEMFPPLVLFDLSTEVSLFEKSIKVC